MTNLELSDIFNQVHYLNRLQVEIFKREGKLSIEQEYIIFFMCTTIETNVLRELNDLVV